MGAALGHRDAIAENNDSLETISYPSGGHPEAQMGLRFSSCALLRTRCRNARFVRGSTDGLRSGLRLAPIVATFGPNKSTPTEIFVTDVGRQPQRRPAGRCRSVRLRARWNWRRLARARGVRIVLIRAPPRSNSTSDRNQPRAFGRRLTISSRLSVPPLALRSAHQLRQPWRYWPRCGGLRPASSMPPFVFD